MSPVNSQHRYVRLDENEPEDPSGDIELQSGTLKRPFSSTSTQKSTRSDGSGSPDSFTDNADHDDAGRLIQSFGVDGAPSSPSPSEPIFPQTYPWRWVQLFYLSTLALISDWVCFSTASIPDVFEDAYPGKSSEGLIDKFLFMNVVSCLMVTDVVARFGLQKCIKASSLLMAIGCWLRSGLGIVPTIFELVGVEEDHREFLETKVFGIPLFGLPPYPIMLVGTLAVGMAQPFFQCTPPLLSAQWFASNERATSSAIALNFNQVGIAMAFLVAGKMAGDDGANSRDELSSNEGLTRYFALIAVLATLTSVGTHAHFRSLPPVPPSASEVEKLQKNQNHPEPPFHASVRTFFSTPGFTKPLAAFIFSIAITNVVGAFIDDVMERGGVTDRHAIAWAGCGFEMAIVIGGIVLGKYVDRTKEYKRVTLACIAISLLLLLPLGMTEHKIGKEPTLLIISLLLLGFFVGPVQPINAELAVDVTYPGDETAVESVQQFGGNFCSAILVPVAGRAAKLDYQLLPNIDVLASDIRGDVVFMVILAVGTFWFYRSFDAPLRRSMADGE